MRRTWCLIALVPLLACDGETSANGGPGTGGMAPGAGGTDPGQPTCDAAAEPFGTDPGDSFADVELTACDGSKQSLQTLRCDNQITFIAVGASWCEPCKQEAPHLQDAFESFAAQDLDIGITQVLVQGSSPSLGATTTDCQAWTETFTLSFPVFVDPIGNTMDNFEDAAEFPLSAIIARDGEVLWWATEAPADIEATILEYYEP